MKSKKKHNHSRTAHIAALYRAVANKEFQGREIGGDYLAELFLPFHERLLIKSKRMRARGKAREKRHTPGVYEYMIARTAFFDDLFQRAFRRGFSQIVLFGAGYDTRFYRFGLLNHDVRIFELDSPGTQNRKLGLLKKHGIEIPENIIHVAIDFNHEAIDETLKKAGFRKAVKTLFMVEGVFMYLPPHSVDAVLKSIVEAGTRDCSLAFDYPASIDQDELHRYHGAENVINALKNPELEESLNFTVKESEIGNFLSERGFVLISHWDPQRLEETYLTVNNNASLGKPNEIFRIAEARVAG